jgi:hypothetical protein
MENINVQENPEVADMALPQALEAGEAFFQTDAEVGGDPIEAGTAEEDADGTPDGVTIH